MRDTWPLLISCLVFDKAGVHFFVELFEIFDSTPVAFFSQSVLDLEMTAEY